MLRRMSIADVVLVDRLELDFQAGLTVLTGETGAGKSIILDSLNLALGARADSGLIRKGCDRAAVGVEFEPGDHDALNAYLEDKGLAPGQGEPLLLRRVIERDGRSKAYVNDQPVSLNVLKGLSGFLLEVHGQHETVGLLDARQHARLLDDYAGAGPEARAVAQNWQVLKALRQELIQARLAAQTRAERIAEATMRLEELDRLDPKDDEETELAGERSLLGASERALEDIAEARAGVGGDQLSQRLSKAFRALDHARARASHAGAEEGHEVLNRLSAAADALDRTLIAAEESLALMDAAAHALDVEPGRLDRVEERLFALRAMARKLNIQVCDLPRERTRLRQSLADMEDAEGQWQRLEQAIAKAEATYQAAVLALRAKRLSAAQTLGAAVMAELKPLKLDKAQFRVTLTELDVTQYGPNGGDQIAFEIKTNPGADWGGLAVIASGGELARFALALKAALATTGSDSQPVMIFDEVDQGVGGAVAEAVGLRLKALAQKAQVIVVTHSPQVAARADQHLKVAKRDRDGLTRSDVSILSYTDSLEELARMLAGAEITSAARAAAVALKSEPNPA